MTSGELEARLRRALTLDAPDVTRIDMSREAITRRLEEAAAMSALCWELDEIGQRVRGVVK